MRQVSTAGYRRRSDQDYRRLTILHAASCHECTIHLLLHRSLIVNRSEVGGCVRRNARCLSRYRWVALLGLTATLFNALYALEFPRRSWRRCELSMCNVLFFTSVALAPQSLVSSWVRRCEATAKPSKASLLGIVN
jgi:hypothetical protein